MPKQFMCTGMEFETLEEAQTWARKLASTPGRPFGPVCIYELRACVAPKVDKITVEERDQSGALTHSAEVDLKTSVE